ncbi:oxidoreductase [Gordonia sp. SID5947]|uniref:FAD-dependent oxidoreductase n=1 Tax=Gordonia sp. SID5947 TaxID=2690315 RepID=UPI001371FB48|nr:FAD-dependent oxidoreductase [Gordonia sp. SID5947]MYR06558.1 oxidoreductase [Gordonia sp. SID5947]
MTRLIPSWLTAHRAVLLSLLLLAVVAFVVSATDDEFAYRPDELALSLTIAVLVIGFVTYLGAAVIRVPPGSDSWLITALILFFILPGVTDSGSAITVAVGAAAAGASKYVLAWRRRVVINPAVAGAVVVYALAYAEVGSIGYPLWWIAAKPLVIPMIVIGMLLVTVLREWRLVVVFLVATLATIGVLEMTEGGQSLEFWYASSPTFFVAAVMLPEPLTSPTTRMHRSIYGAIVGVLMYWQVSIPVTDSFSLEFVPETALLVGSLYAFIVRLVTHSPSARRMPLVPAGRARAIAADTYEMELSAPAPTTFVPGQWALLSTPAWSRPVWRGSRRVFSFADAPGTDGVRFAFTASGTPSHFKRALIASDNLRVFLDSSGGDFVLPRTRRGRPIVLLASGIGITPFRSMLCSAIADGGDLSRVTLIHVVRTADREVFGDVLDVARDAGASVRVVESADHADGLDDGALRELIGDIDGSPHYFASGNPRFVRSSARSIRRLDPASRWQFWRVHTDAFLGY